MVTLGDGWHATSKTPPQFAEALGRLKTAAANAGRRLRDVELSLRFTLSDDLLGKGPQAVVDLLGEYQRLGLSHVVLEFRRDDLKRMLEILDVVTTSIRPAFARA